MRTLKLVIMSMFLVSVVSYAADTKHQYVGVQVCKMCHQTEKNGQQFQKWQASKHAEAMKVLSTPEAQKIADAKGIKGKASDAKECVECHETGYDAEASMLGPKFSKDDGVQCESCHGPGKDYMSMAVMKDRQKAVAAGLNLVSASDGSAEKLCDTCHNKKSPTFKAFDFKKMWAQIAHPAPKQ